MLTRRALVPLAAAALAGVYPIAASGSSIHAAVRFRNVVLASQGNYGEPSLALAPDGRHVAVCVPGGGGTKVWWSGDDGHTFGTTATTSNNGGGDCELDFLPNGTLLNADLEVTDSNVKVSKDFGKTFDGGRPVGVEQDRQWFAHSPDGKTAYLVYHDFAAEGEFFARSTDGGLTWPAADGANPVNGADQVAPGTAVTPAQGGSPASIVDQGGNTFSGPMLISPDGRDSYVVYSISDIGSNAKSATPPYGPTRGIIVAHKSAEAAAFTNKYAVTSNNGEVNGAIFPWGTIDKAGNVYLLYNSDLGSPGHFHTYYKVSKDKAATWSAPVKVDDAPLDRGAQLYSTGMAGANGVLDMAWYGTDNGANPGDKTSTWKVHFAQIRNATSAHPQITRAIVSPGNIHAGDICLNGLLCTVGGDRSLLDFFELAIGKDGMAYIAYANNAGFGQHPSTGLTAPVTHAVVKNGRVVFAKQTSGRSAWSK
ncbi:MAG: glycoside hydrolase [Actinomycetota bacterium]|nr:glycoside hydrolase [Actinomycetota bacterium]